MTKRIGQPGQYEDFSGERIWIKIFTNLPHTQMQNQILGLTIKGQRYYKNLTTMFYRGE
jgi:hypothetical protein